MKKLKRLSKRGFTLFVALTMCLSLMNVTAFAAEDAGAETQIMQSDSESPDSNTSENESSSKEEAGSKEETPTEEEDANEPAEDEEDANEPAEGEEDANQPAEGEEDANQPAEGEEDANQPAEGEEDANQPAVDENGNPTVSDEPQLPEGILPGEEDLYLRNEDGTFVLDGNGMPILKPVEEVPPVVEETSGALGTFLSKIETIGSGELDMDQILAAIEDCLSSYEQLSEEEKAALADAYAALLAYQGELLGELPPAIMPETPVYSEAVQAFLDAAAQLPGEVTKENVEEVSAALESLLALYQNLSEEEQELEDVMSAYACVLALWEQAEGVKAALLVSYPLEYTENNITYELYEDGTAKVVSGEKDRYYRIIVPASVTYQDQEYRVTVIGEKAFYNKGYAQVTLNEGLETIESYAFGYTYLYGNDLKIPDSVISIGERAFLGFNRYASEKYHINKIIFGDGLKTIGYCAFYYNVDVTDYGTVNQFPVEIECGTNLESVDSWAFYYRYDYNAVSSVTVRGYEGTMDDVLNKVYAFGAVGLTYTMVDADNITSVAALQKAINLAEDGVPTTLTLNKRNFVVKDSIVIPAGKDITLIDPETEVVFEMDDYKSNKPMFIIENGGKLTIDATGPENLIINGAALGAPGRLTASVFQVKGELVLKNGLINGGIGPAMGSGMFSGAIVLGDGAKFDMTGGTLRGTSTDGAHSAPVVVGSGAEFNMSGGKITENDNSTSIYDGYAAGAVLVYGWNAGDVGGKMTLTGDARISGNSTKGVGGAITLVGNAVLYMDGGVITGNQSTGGSGSNGGGVCVAGRTGGMSSSYDVKCIFTMDGGEISNNFANYGGGIYVNSNRVTLNAGTISHNEAWGTGGGVYVETPSGSKTGAQVNNALITGNTATVMGGGMYFCPTGFVTMSAFEGVAVFDNQAYGAADDFVTVVPSLGVTTSTLAARMLGGGKVDWYRDGKVTETAIVGGWGWVTEDSVRFNAENPGVPVEAGAYSYSLALKAIASDGAKALAKEDAKLFITGNSAQRGGGIGANGTVTAGDVNREEWSLRVNAKKMWEGISENEWEPVTFQLMIDGRVIETVTLSAENDWSYAFMGLPVSAKDQISIKEITGTYHVTYTYETQEGKAELTITVTNSPGGSLTITKAIQGGGSAALEKTYTFIVTGPEDYSQTVKIKGADSVTLSGLKPGSYTVKEETSDAEIPGFNWRVEGDNVTADVAAKETAGVTITNIYEEPETPSGTGSLTITKVVNGGGSAAREKTYTFTVTGPDGFSRTVTITGAGSVLLEDLEPGEYTVTEDRAGAVISGYTLSISGSGSTASVVAGGTANVTVTNTYTTPGGGNPGGSDPEDPTPPPTPEEPEIPEEDVPLTDIPEEEVPLVEIPEKPEEFEIPEEEVPLANVPETGDLGGGWMMAMLMGALGLLWMALTGKDKKRSEGEEV